MTASLLINYSSYKRIFHIIFALKQAREILPLSHIAIASRPLQIQFIASH